MDSQSSLATGPPFRPPIENRTPLFIPGQRKVIQTLEEDISALLPVSALLRSKTFTQERLFPRSLTGI